MRASCTRPFLLIIGSSAVLLSFLLNCDCALGLVVHYDRFGVESDMLHGEGHMSLSCDLNNLECKAGESIVIVHEESNDEIGSYVNNPENREAFKTGPIHSLKFGRYVCKCGSAQTEAFQIDYRTCLSNSTECQLAQCKTGAEPQFCTTSFNSTEDCDAIPRGCITVNQSLNSYYYCPVGQRNFCDAVAANYAKVWYRKKTDCKKSDGQWQLRYDNRSFLYEEPVFVNASDSPQFEISCEKNCPNIHWQLIDISGVLHNEMDSLSYVIPSQLLDNGSRVLKLVGRTRDENVAMFSNNLILFDAVTWQELTRGKDGYISQVEVFLNHQPIDNGFMIGYKWFNGSGDVVAETSAFSPNTEDTFTCQIIITYKTCTPFTIFEYISECGSFEMKGEAPGSILGIVIGCVFFVFLLLFLGLSMFGYHRHFERDMYCALKVVNARPYEPMQTLTKGSGAMNYRAFKREAERLFRTPATAKPEKKYEKFLKRLGALPRNIMDKGHKVEENEKASVTGCRDETIPIMKDTRVVLRNFESGVCLHMNELRDYHGNKLLLCQAPLKSQFLHQWMAIWQENVGLVIWVGALGERNKKKIDEYINLVEGTDPMSIGPFCIRTDMAVTIVGQCNLYYVTVGCNNDARNIVFAHLYTWPENSLPLETALLSEAVSQVLLLQQNQSDIGLPVVMCHCSNGVNESAAFVAVYVGTQMWLDKRVLNMRGIIQHVQRHRYNSFGTAIGFVQVQVAFSILLSLATKYQYEGVCAFKPRSRLVPLRPPSGIKLPCKTDRPKSTTSFKCVYQ